MNKAYNIGLIGDKRNPMFNYITQRWTGQVYLAPEVDIKAEFDNLKSFSDEQTERLLNLKGSLDYKAYQQHKHNIAERDRGVSVYELPLAQIYGQIMNKYHSLDVLRTVDLEKAMNKEHFDMVIDTGFNNSTVETLVKDAIITEEIYSPNSLPGIDAMIAGYLRWV